MVVVWGIITNSLLRWKDIDMEHNIIRRPQDKTHHIVEIPIMPSLAEYLRTIKKDGSEYVLPVHAAMYQKNQSSVSRKIKRFLEEECHIETTRIPQGRTRAVSIKDLHSCRHTFCYLAVLNNIPLNIVQSIVGHMTPEMTKHYANHADIEAKREPMNQLNSILPFSDDAIPVSAETIPESNLPPILCYPTEEEQERQRILKDISACIDGWGIEGLKKLLDTCQKLNRKSIPKIPS